MTVCSKIFFLWYAETQMRFTLKLRASCFNVGIKQEGLSIHLPDRCHVREIFQIAEKHLANQKTLSVIRSRYYCCVDSLRTPTTLKSWRDRELWALRRWASADTISMVFSQRLITAVSWMAMPVFTRFHQIHWKQIGTLISTLLLVKYPVNEAKEGSYQEIFRQRGYPHKNHQMREKKEDFLISFNRQLRRGLRSHFQKCVEMSSTVLIYETLWKPNREKTAIVLITTDLGVSEWVLGG